VEEEEEEEEEEGKWCYSSMSFRSSSTLNQPADCRFQVALDPFR
jgi:hypothetical protein